MLENYDRHRHNYIYQCNQYRTGTGCQTDSRPCSSNPCLNNDTCSCMNNETSFQFFCQSNLYYGTYCENKVDLCSNSTGMCYKNQGYCIMNDTQPMCKCLTGYSGTKCEITSASLVVRNAIINASSIIAIIVLVSFVIIVLCFDYTKYFLMNKRNSINNKPHIKKFYYTSWKRNNCIKK